MTNYWIDKANNAPKWIAGHPWVSVLTDTLRHVDPELHDLLTRDNALTAWGIGKTETALALAKSYVDTGMDEPEANAMALADVMPKTVEDEMQYTDGDDEAAQEEAALEWLDTFGDPPT